MISPNVRVSALSLYGDSVWDFSVELAPQRLRTSRHSRSFALDLADGTSLLDSINAALLNDDKRLSFFLLHEDDENPRKPSAITQLKGPFNYLFNELVVRGHRSLAPFCFDVANEIVESTLHTHQNPEHYIDLYLKLWHYREVLAHPPMQPPSPVLIERWRRIARAKTNPTPPLEPEEALMLSGWALTILRRSTLAHETLSSPTPTGFDQALSRLEPSLDLMDVLSSIQIIILLEASLRSLELVTLPTECLSEKDSAGTASLFALNGFRWKRRKGTAGIPSTWAASHHVAQAVTLLRRLALLYGQDVLIFTRKHCRCRPANSTDIYQDLRSFANKWKLMSLSGEPLDIKPRRLRATSTMLAIRFGGSDARHIGKQLQHAPGSHVTEGSYCQLAPLDLERLKNRAPLPLETKYGPLSVAT